MCTYSQLKKKKKNYGPKLYSSGGIDISKSIEGGSMKLFKLVGYICVCAVMDVFPCNECFFLFF